MTAAPRPPEKLAAGVSIRKTAAENGALISTVQRIILARNAGLPQDRRIDLRIGVNLGDVIVAPDDIYGHGVNIAARLESLAPPGGICISADVWRHVRGAIAADFVDLGEQRLKNIADPAPFDLVR